MIGQVRKSFYLVWLYNIILGAIDGQETVLVEIYLPVSRILVGVFGPGLDLALFGHGDYFSLLVIGYIQNAVLESQPNRLKLLLHLEHNGQGKPLPNPGQLDHPRADTIHIIDVTPVTDHHL
jgi:hypothetical protein